MAINPLDLVTSPDQAPVPQPGFFDGQMPAVPASDDIDLGGENLLGEAPSIDEPVSLLKPEPGPETEEFQVAGVGTTILKSLFQGGAKTTKRLDDVVGKGRTAGQVGEYTVIREATPEEVLDYNTLTGKTSGAPSPTTAQRAEGIPTAEFNLENIDGPDALKGTIDKVAEMWKDAGRAAGRGKMSWEETQALAKGMGLDRTVERLLRREVGTAMNAEEITASLQAIATSGMELNRLAKIAATSTDSRDLLKFRQHLAFQSALQTNMKGAQMEAGRALAAFRIPRGVGEDVDAQSITNIMEQFGGDKSVREMANAYLILPSQAQRNKFSYGAWDKIKGTWFEVWINGLLSAPATHFANITGNAMFQFMQVPERFGAGLIGLARQVMGSKADRVHLQETISDLVGAVQGIGDGWRLAGEAWRTEAPVRDLASKIEASKRRMITGANLIPDADAIHQRWVDYIGAGIRLPGRALMTADEFFKAVAYRRELNSLATRRALDMKRNGASVDDIAETLDDVFAGRHEDISKSAEEFAQYATFTNPVEGFLGAAGASIQGTTLGRMLVPFFRTPVNIFKAAAERSPYGFVKAIANAKDPIKRDVLIARASMGTAAMGYAANEYINGGITGTGPTDGNMRKQLESLGWKKWSLVSPKEGVENPRWIQVGHMYIQHPDDVDYVSYAKLEPASMVLAIAADVAERFRWPTATQEEIEDIVMSGLDTVFDYMKDQTFMRGFANIAGVISKRTGTERNTAVSRLVQDLIGSQVPFSSLLASIERVQNPLMDSIIPDRNEPMGLRDLYAGLKKLDGRVPFTETDGPILRDRFGNPRIQKGANIRSVLLPPFMADILGEDIKKIEADPVMVEVVAAGVPLTMPPRKIDGVPLTAEEYDAFVKFAAHPPSMKARNKTVVLPSFYDALEQTVTLKAFKEASMPIKQDLIKAIDADYKAIAKMFLLDDPEYQDRFADLRQKVFDHREIIEAVGRQGQ